LGTRRKRLNPDSLAAILNLKRDSDDRCAIAMEQDASRTGMRPARKTAQTSFHAAPNPRPWLIFDDLREGACPKVFLVDI